MLVAYTHDTFQCGGLSGEGHPGNSCISVRIPRADISVFCAQFATVTDDVPQLVTDPVYQQAASAADTRVGGVPGGGGAGRVHMHIHGARRGATWVVRCTGLMVRAGLFCRPRLVGYLW